MARPQSFVGFAQLAPTRRSTARFRLRAGCAVSILRRGDLLSLARRRAHHEHGLRAIYGRTALQSARYDLVDVFVASRHRGAFRVRTRSGAAETKSVEGSGAAAFRCGRAAEKA